MPRQLILPKRFEKTLRLLPAECQARIVKALHRYAQEGLGDVKHLAGSPNRWRLRVGDYRVILEVSSEMIEVLRVAHRREIYR